MVLDGPAIFFSWHGRDVFFDYGSECLLILLPKHSTNAGPYYLRLLDQPCLVFYRRGLKDRRE